MVIPVSSVSVVDVLVAISSPDTINLHIPDLFFNSSGE